MPPIRAAIVNECSKVALNVQTNSEPCLKAGPNPEGMFSCPCFLFMCRLFLPLDLIFPDEIGIQKHTVPIRLYRFAGGEHYGFAPDLGEPRHGTKSSPKCAPVEMDNIMNKMDQTTVAENLRLIMGYQTCKEHRAAASTAMKTDANRGGAAATKQSGLLFPAPGNAGGKTGNSFGLPLECSAAFAERTWRKGRVVSAMALRSGN